MAERKKQCSKSDGNKKAPRKLSGSINVTHIVQSEKGKLKIGNYILGTTLGNGTFGKVKREQCLHSIWMRFLVTFCEQVNPTWSFCYWWYTFKSFIWMYLPEQHKQGNSSIYFLMFYINLLLYEHLLDLLSLRFLQ